MYATDLSGSYAQFEITGCLSRALSRGAGNSEQGHAVAKPSAY